LIRGLPWVALLALAAGGAAVAREGPSGPGPPPAAAPEGDGSWYGGRRGGHRLEKHGGGPGTEDAVRAGLEWLAAHQSADGGWDPAGFEARCGDHGKCGGPGERSHAVGVTGLALLAFLGYGETHKTPRYGAVVRAALKRLKASQDGEGCFGPRTHADHTYDHALAALAFTEAFGLTRSPLFQAPAQEGVDFILHARNPDLAWRYGVRPGDNDTSVTAWMVLALRSAKEAGLEVDGAALRAAKAWLDRVTDPESGRAGYTVRGNGPCRTTAVMEKFPPAKSESLTAMAILSRLLVGEGRDADSVRKGADLCAARLPVRDDPGAVDFLHWHFGTLALFQVGGERWERWNGAMKGTLLAMQRKGEAPGVRGSWDPADPWAAQGGRVVSTALNTLTLESYYRYARLPAGK
jgi:hypothetical protein